MSEILNWSQSQVLEDDYYPVGSKIFSRPKFKDFTKQMQEQAHRHFPDVDLQREAIATVNAVFDKRYDKVSPETKSRYMNGSGTAERAEMRKKARFGYHYNENGAVIAEPIWAGPARFSTFDERILLDAENDMVILLADILSSHQIYWDIGPSKEQDDYIYRYNLPIYRLAMQILKGEAILREETQIARNGEEKKRLVIDQRKIDIDVRYNDQDGTQWRLNEFCTVFKENEQEGKGFSSISDYRRGAQWTESYNVENPDLEQIVTSLLPQPELNRLVTGPEHVVETQDPKMPGVDIRTKIQTVVAFLPENVVQKNGSIKHPLFPVQFAYKKEYLGRNEYYTWEPVTFKSCVKMQQGDVIRGSI